MAPKDARDSTRIANYSSKWDKDSSLDSKTHTENRLEEYKDVVNGQYASLRARKRKGDELTFTGALSFVSRLRR
jgi:hypothetical protein